MFEMLAKDERLNSLSDVVNAMIKTDLKLKLQATAIAAKQLQTFDEANEFLEKIYQLESLALQSSQLLFESNKLLRNGTRKNTVSTKKVDKIDEHQRKISLLTIELGTYLYYLTTLQEYFTYLNIEQFKQDEIDQINNLARARHLFAYSIAESRRIITSFRQSHKMDCQPAFGKR